MFPGLLPVYSRLPATPLVPAAMMGHSRTVAATGLLLRSNQICKQWGMFPGLLPVYSTRCNGPGSSGSSSGPLSYGGGHRVSSAEPCIRMWCAKTPCRSCGGLIYV